MLKIGVLGAGHLGKIHLKCIQQIPSYEPVGFFDPDERTAKSVMEELHVRAFHSIDALVDAVDVVDIVTPTVQHFNCAATALRKRKHVFIEKPIVATPDEARVLKQLADEAGVKVQVGHVERFNPAFIAAEPHITVPLFIEAHRLSLFNMRGLDVPVVLDLMVHDLDICSPSSNRLWRMLAPAAFRLSARHRISPMHVSNLKTARWPTLLPAAFP